jgi:hypothetical protein
MLRMEASVMKLLWSYYEGSEVRILMIETEPVCEMLVNLNRLT